MLESAHSFTGAVIGYKIGSPLAALLTSLISHFAIDLLPHWNPSLIREKTSHGQLRPKTKIFIYVDSFFGLVLGLLVAAKALPDWPRVVLILASCLAAILPDLVEAPFFFLGHQNKYISKLMDFQNRHQWKVPLVPGILSQIIYVALLFWLLGK